MERKIKVIVLENLSSDDVMRLKAGGFFDGAQMPMPAGVTGQEATLRVREDGPKLLGTVLDPAEQSNTSESLKPVRTKAPAAAETPVSAPTKPAAAPKAADQGESQTAPRSEPIAQPSAPAVEIQPVVEAPIKAEPKGNGKKLPAQHAVKGGTYVVRAFGESWTGLFLGTDKAGPKFKLEGKSEPNEVYVTPDVVIEEVSVEGADLEAADVNLDIDISVPTMLGFTKLRDLLQYLLQSGIPAAGAVDFCESMKEEVPLLQRISNIPDRVQRTLEVMGAM